MTWCPVCGAWMWNTKTFLGEVVACASCGATLTCNPHAPGLSVNRTDLVLDVLEFLFGRLSPEEYESEPYRPLYSDRRTDVPETYGESYRLYADRLKDSKKAVSLLKGQSATRTLSEKRSPPEGVLGGRCSHCNARIMATKENFCHNCGALLTREWGDLKPIVKTRRVKTKQSVTDQRQQQQIDNCAVCELALSQGDDVVWCPHCGRLSHRSHLIEWVRRKGRCPACGEKLEERYYE